MTDPGPMTDAEKRAELKAFLGPMHAYLADGSRELTTKFGRGFWYASMTRSCGQFRGCGWVPADNYGKLLSTGKLPPPGLTRDMPRQMETYDPEHQWLLLLEHRDGSLTSSLQREVPIGRG